MATVLSKEPRDQPLPPLAVVVVIRNEHVTEVVMPPACCVHVLNYNSRWPECLLESDEHGVPCRQTVFSRRLNDDEPIYRFKLVVSSGQPQKVIMPHVGCSVTVRLHLNGVDAPVEKSFRRGK